MLPLESLVQTLNSLPPEVVLGGIAVVCGLSMALLGRFFGFLGLTLYITLAVLISNIQVLKAIELSFLSEPLALGTVVFSSTFACSDIIAEHYGTVFAKRAVWMSFAGALIMSCLMVLTVGLTPLDSSYDPLIFGRYRDAHEAMKTLFTPSVSIFAASLLSYIISQYNDIWLFARIRRLCYGRHLWLRTVVSTALASLLDNIIFSVLAWVVLAPDPVSWRTLVFTYILGTYVFRLFLTVVNTPLLYLSYRFLKPEKELFSCA